MAIKEWFEQIIFLNGFKKGPAINDTNLNKMQKNINQAFDDVNKKVEKTLLYDGGTAGSQSNITLLDFANNYNYLEIEYRCIRKGSVYGVKKIITNSTNFSLFEIFYELVSSVNVTKGSTTNYTINDNNIAVAGHNNFEIHQNGYSANANNSFYITKIYGLEKKE